MRYRGQPTNRGKAIHVRRWADIHRHARVGWSEYVGNSIDGESKSNSRVAVAARQADVATAFKARLLAKFAAKQAATQETDA